MDCSPFLSWSEDADETVEEKAVVFRSLVATLKLQPSLDDSLEAKVVKFLESVVAQNQNSADAFLDSLASNSGDSSPDFIKSILGLISFPSQDITTAAIKMFDSLFGNCSAQGRLALVQAGLIRQLVITLNPQSLSFTEAVDIHINLLKRINMSVWLTTPDGLRQLGIEDDDELQAVSETVLQQVLSPSEKYICHLCANRYSIVDGVQSCFFLELLTRLLQISPLYQPTMDFVLDMPVVITIPSCLAFYTIDEAIWYFLYYINKIQREWNNKMGEVRQISKKLDGMLKMEGVEDVMEEKLLNDERSSFGEVIVTRSIEWNNQQGMNVPERR